MKRYITVTWVVPFGKEEEAASFTSYTQVPVCVCVEKGYNFWSDSWSQRGAFVVVGGLVNMFALSDSNTFHAPILQRGKGAGENCGLHLIGPISANFARVNARSKLWHSLAGVAALLFVKLIFVRNIKIVHVCWHLSAEDKCL